MDGPPCRPQCRRLDPIPKLYERTLEPNDSAFEILERPRSQRENSGVVEDVAYAIGAGEHVGDEIIGRPRVAAQRAQLADLGEMVDHHAASPVTLDSTSRNTSARR